MSTDTVIHPELLWNGRDFVASESVHIDSAGLISAVALAASGEPSPLAGPGTEGTDRATPPGHDDRPRLALMPGFVSAHSHAFQRGLRGRGERFPAGSGSFWTWRTAMYDLVGAMTVDQAYMLSRMAFEEMLDAGITTVGEFHYLHHASDDRDWKLDDAVLRAAADAGIRCVLLQTAYFTGGIGAPLEGGQRRFDGVDVDQFLRQLDAVGGRLGPRQHPGLAAHSIRAVAIADVARLWDAARERGLVMHMHLEEQPAEIAACQTAHGATPLGVVTRALGDLSGVVAVHATHSTPEDLAAFGAAGGSVCLCPLTEANLGDGLADVAAMRAAGIAVSLGSDSNARISMLEEMRWMEYGQRLRREARGVVRDADGYMAPELIDAGTRQGAAALGLNAGRIEPGQLADLVAIDLDHPSLFGATADTLPEALLTGAADGAVAGTWVAGEWRARRA